MTQNRISPAAAKATIDRLVQPPRLSNQHPIAARAICALRLIAIHERAGRDPVPELTMRLGSVETAAQVLFLAQAIQSVWPEDIHVAPVCCCRLTHDETTIGAMIDGAIGHDRGKFDGAVDGLVRPDRIYRLWDGVLRLVDAEARAF